MNKNKVKAYISGPIGKRPKEEYESHFANAEHVLLDCDIIYMLDGWPKSPGAKAECAVADSCGIVILGENTPGDFLSGVISVVEKQKGGRDD